MMHYKMMIIKALNVAVKKIQILQILRAAKSLKQRRNNEDFN